MQHSSTSDAIKAGSSAGANPVIVAGALEEMRAPRARFHVECLEAHPDHRQEYLSLHDRIVKLTETRDFSRAVRIPVLGRHYQSMIEKRRQRLLAEQRRFAQVKWTEEVDNLVTNGGKADLLDKYFGGSSYTAAWFCGLVSSVSFSAYNAADTMASHAGWTEAGATNAPNYTGNRPALAFAAASGGSKATSSPSSFTFSGAGTIKGMFGTTVATKDGTTGILYNAVNFTGGDRVVAASDVVNVSVTYTA